MKGLYVIIDPEHCRGRAPSAIAEQALRGGARVLQLRAKRLTDAALLLLARDLRARCSAHGAAFWLNDRLDIALLADADGLHLGQDDLPPHEARKLAPRLALGLSTHSLAQVSAARAQGIATIGFGPIFATQTKEHPSPTVGIAGLRAACAAEPELSVIAIGGVQLAHAADIARSGASYAAVISAVCAADDPEAAARALSDALGRSARVRGRAKQKREPDQR
jgi:thiamine-phosphate pyrophosphorylase